MEIKSIGLVQQGVKVKEGRLPPESVRPKSAEPDVVVHKEPDVEKLVNNKAVFAIIDDKYVVIQVLDKDGNVLRQIPPEEWIASVRSLQEAFETLFSKEV